MRKRLTFEIVASPDDPRRVIVHRYFLEITNRTWNFDTIFTWSIDLYDISHAAMIDVHRSLEMPKAAP